MLSLSIFFLAPARALQLDISPTLPAIAISDRVTPQHRPPCRRGTAAYSQTRLLTGTATPSGAAHHLSRRLKALGHDARLMPAKYVRGDPSQLVDKRDHQ